MNFQFTIKQINGRWWFFVGTLIFYFIICLMNPMLLSKSLLFFVKILARVTPVLLIVWFFMALMDRYVTKQTIIRYLSQDKRKQIWLVAIIGGILSAGAIYMWYPLLDELHKQGVDYGLIACFLYNRAIKLPLLPVAIYYFGWKYVTILTILMIIASVVQGIIVNWIIKDNKIS